MRLFIGIKASANLKRKIGKWQEERKTFPVRFIKPENLHLTLVPPWYEDDPADSISKLGSLAWKRCTVVFDNIGINFRNHVIWIESSNPPKELSSTYNDLLHLFQKKKEKRPFRVHITIARFKDAKPLKHSKFHGISWKENVTAITLFQSKLTPKEAQYKEIFSQKI